MGTFAETANVDYPLSVTGQGKQTSFFYFHLQQTNGSYPFATYNYVRKMELNGNFRLYTANGKQKAL
jgi:hypothetical protein